jgi:hypothetical protein
MLNIEMARKIGINACIEKLGREFVLAHKDRATSAFGECENGVFCFVGVDDGSLSDISNNALILDSHSAFPYRASCNVSLVDGMLSFIECIIPVQ